MSDHYTVLGLYRKVETITKAGDPIREAFRVKDGDIEVLTSAAYPDGAILDDKELLHQVESRQFLFPFLMGFGGFGAGVTLAGGTGYIMNLIVGGKAPFTYAPTGVVTYEFTLLFGVIGSVLSLLYYAGLPNWTERAYDPEVSDGALGLLVKLYSTEDQEKAAKMMEEHGAYKIKKGVNDF
ncbi:MAG: DUF3341 domain-containing protein [Nitrospinota bacterium]|nr:DUF3341 domain-containing protein [Nitrospinota bacterium]